MFSRLGACRLALSVRMRLNEAITSRLVKGAPSWKRIPLRSLNCSLVPVMQLCYLISYAAQQASGSRAWVGDDEHIEKAFDYGGMPARNGVTAALLVQSGLTGNQDVLEGDQGIVKTYVPCDPQKLLSELGQRFTITSCLIKK